MKRTLLSMAALLLLAPGGVTHAGKDREPDRLPLESRGDLRFFVDLSGYRGESGKTDQEIYVSITNDEVGFKEVEAGGLLAGAIRLGIRVLDEDEKEVFQLETALEPQAATRLDADDRAILQIIRESAQLAPGRYRFEVTVVDENTLKTGLFNRMRNKKKRGSASGWYDVLDYGGEGLQLSELVLVRKYAPAEDSAFGRNGIDFDPNPSRLYGLPLPTVGTYVEVYGGSDFEPGDTFLVRTQVLDRTESPVKERLSKATPASAAFVVTDGLNLAGDIAAGSYLLDVTVMNKRTRDQANSRRPFEVIWSVASWGQDPDEVFQEMRLIMSESDFRTLEKLAPGAREIFLAEYWRELDPTPDSPENEVLVNFRKRVRYADHEFASTLQRGILTDRGRVWVRYGPPDDIDYQYSSSSIAGDLGAERVAGPGERASLGTRPNPSFLDTDQFEEGDVGDVASQRGGVNVESKQLEIWRYDGQGNVFTNRQELGSTSHRGLKFIFADEMGDGNYELIGSSGTTLY